MQRLGQGLGELPGEASLAGEVQGVLQRVGGLADLVGRVGVDQAPPALGEPAQPRGRQLGARRRGHAVDQLVRLVDDEHGVLGQDAALLHHVDREQRVVGDDDVGLAGPRPGGLGEAVGALGAVLRADALRGGGGRLAPGAVAHAGVEVVPVAGVGVVRPVVQPLHLLGEGPLPTGPLELLGAFEGALVLVLLAGHLAFADVVVAALEQRERRPAAQDRRDGVHQARQVDGDELVLERQRRRRDHDGLARRERRAQVRQGLAGAGAGLDEQVAAGADGLGHRLGHAALAVPGAAARGGGDRRVEDFERRFGDAGGHFGRRGHRCSTGSSASAAAARSSAASASTSRCLAR